MENAASPEDRELGARLRAAWGYCGLPQNLLAQQLGISDRTLARRFAGEGIDEHLVAAVADATDVPLSFFSTGFIEPRDVLTERVEATERAIRNLGRRVTGLEAVTEELPSLRDQMTEFTRRSKEAVAGQRASEPKATEAAGGTRAPESATPAAPPTPAEGKRRNGRRRAQ